MWEYTYTAPFRTAPPVHGESTFTFPILIPYTSCLPQRDMWPLAAPGA